MKFLKSKMKENKAITLVVLVITIIILLILAGITISQLSGSGLLANAKEARKKWKNAQNEEEMQIAKYSNEIDSYVDGNREMNDTLLWPDSEESTDFAVSDTTINLKSSYTNFKYLQVIGECQSTAVNTTTVTATMLIPTKLIKNIEIKPSNAKSSSRWSWCLSPISGTAIPFYFTSNTSLKIFSATSDYGLIRVYGIN